MEDNKKPRNRVSPSLFFKLKLITKKYMSTFWGFIFAIGVIVCIISTSFFTFDPFFSPIGLIIGIIIMVFSVVAIKKDEENEG